MTASTTEGTTPVPSGTHHEVSTDSSYVYVFDPENDPRRIIIARARGEGYHVLVRVGDETAGIDLSEDDMHQLTRAIEAQRG